jgi:hypothetical protein
VWRSYHCETKWSISECDAEGEIRCIGGDDDMEDAWATACEHAEEIGVPCLLMHESGEEIRRYAPEPVQVATDAEVL